MTVSTKAARARKAQLGVIASYIANAQDSLKSGDVKGHDQWMTAVDNALAAYDALPKLTEDSAGADAPTGAPSTPIAVKRSRRATVEDADDATPPAE